MVVVDGDGDLGDVDSLVFANDLPPLVPVMMIVVVSVTSVVDVMMISSVTTS